MPKVVTPSMPKGSKLVKCDYCNALIVVAPHDFYLWCGDVKTKCPCCGSGISILKAIEL